MYSVESKEFIRHENVDANLQRWQDKSKNCTLHLVIKGIAATVLALLGIAVGLAIISMPVTYPLLIAGKAAVFSVLNPYFLLACLMSILGGLCAASLGIMYGVGCDWTHYSNPQTVKEIVRSFNPEEIVEDLQKNGTFSVWAQRADNLSKYGILVEEHAGQLKTIADTYSSYGKYRGMDAGQDRIPGNKNPLMVERL